MLVRRFLSAPRVLLAAFVFVLGAMLAPAAAHAAGPPAGGFLYTVQSGDTRDSIAARAFVFFGEIIFLGTIEARKQGFTRA